MNSRVKVYKNINTIPKKYIRTLYSLTLRKDGWMLHSARLSRDMEDDRPVTVMFINDKPIGWLLFNMSNIKITNGLHSFVKKQHRTKGYRQRMLIHLKKKYPNIKYKLYKPNVEYEL